MKNLIVIKSFQNGISIIMDPNADFDEMITELAAKFSDARGFFRDVKVALSLEGRLLTTEEEKEIIKTIQENSNVEILCLVGKNEETNKNYVKALKRVEYEKEENNGRFYRGNLKASQTLESENSIVVIGNIEPGATIVSAKDIIVVGGLYGEVYAGVGSEENHFIVALDFAPSKCKIGEYRYHSKEKSKWSMKQKHTSQIAFLKEGQICVETITKELPSFL